MYPRALVLTHSERRGWTSPNEKHKQRRRISAVSEHVQVHQQAAACTESTAQQKVADKQHQETSVTSEGFGLLWKIHTKIGLHTPPVGQRPKQQTTHTRGAQDTAVLTERRLDTMRGILYTQTVNDAGTHMFHISVVPCTISEGPGYGQSHTDNPTLRRYCSRPPISSKKSQQQSSFSSCTGGLEFAKTIPLAGASFGGGVGCPPPCSTS